MARKGFFSGINGQSYDDFIRDQEAERKDVFPRSEPAPEQRPREPVVCDNCGSEVDSDTAAHPENSPEATDAFGIFMVIFGSVFVFFGFIPMIIGFIIEEPLMIFIPMIFVIVGIAIIIFGSHVYAHRDNPDLVSISVEKTGKE